MAPDNRLMAVEVNGSGNTFQVGQVRPLFQTRPRLGLRRAYDVTADGQRFLVNALVEQGASTPVTLLMNWPALLGR